MPPPPHGATAGDQTKRWRRRSTRSTSLAPRRTQKRTVRSDTLAFLRDELVKATEAAGAGAVTSTVDVNCNHAVLAWVVRLLVTDLPGPARPNIP